VGSGDGDNHVTGNDDLLHTRMGIGSQIDGLGHISIEQVYVNGGHARDLVRITGQTRFSNSDLPALVTRGLVLDLAGLQDTAILDEVTAFNCAEIKGVMRAQGMAIRAGDVVLRHTGWVNVADTGSPRFLKGEPGT